MDILAEATAQAHPEMSVAASAVLDWTDCLAVTRACVRAKAGSPAAVRALPPPTHTHTHGIGKATLQMGGLVLPMWG